MYKSLICYILTILLKSSKCDVTIQEIATKIKNVAIDVKDTVALTGSTTSVKQFAEILNGIKSEIVEEFSEFRNSEILDDVKYLKNTLGPIIEDLLSLDVNNENYYEEVEEIKKNVNRAAIGFTVFVRNIQESFNDQNEEVPKIDESHLANLMEIQQRTRRARVNVAQLGPYGI